MLGRSPECVNCVRNRRFSVQGYPRPGPIFGGMFLSGVKAAKLALEKVNKDGRFHKNHISQEVMAAVNV